MKSLRKSLLVAALAAGSLAMTSLGVFAQEITIAHAQGETVLPGTPQKVLVLDISSLDTLTALGVEVAGVPGSNIPAYMSQYEDDDYLKIGTLFEPDYEAINAAEADLIVVGGRSAAKYPDLSAMLPTIDMSVDATNYLDSVKANVVTLGEVFGKQAEAAALVAELEAKIEKLHTVSADAGTALILLTNAGKVSAYGPTSRVGWLHNEAGFETVSDTFDQASHGDVVAFEYLLESNPDWLFVIDRDAGIGQANEGQAAAQVLDNELVAQTTAWQKGQVVYLDPAAAYIVSGGYTALGTLMDQVYTAVSAAR